MERALLRGRERTGDLMNWQNLTSWLAPLQTRWDIAVLANLPANGGWTRPADLRDAINSQAGPERQISWKVLRDTLRRLEAEGYIARKEMRVPRVPRETRIWLLDPGRRLITALELLEDWLGQNAGSGEWCPWPGWHACTGQEHVACRARPKTA
jgi:DNA-binding HxlR family transcriptional regulator